MLSALLVGLFSTPGEVEAVSYTLSLEDPNGGTTFDIMFVALVIGMIVMAVAVI